LLLFTEAKKSHYEVLGITAAAADAEIKRAYFNLVRKFQPDRFPEEFKEIRAAYETLIDRQKRAEYDAIGELPSSVAPLFHEAQRYDRLGRCDKAAELYQFILKSHPELDKVREEYAFSLSADDKTGKAVEVWEELCKRQPGNPRYARELSRSYLDRGWHKKALSEIQRALSLDRVSLDSWSLRISCFIEGIGNKIPVRDEMREITAEALEAVKEVKADEWKKIYFYTQAFLAAGYSRIDNAREQLREIIRLIREGGRKGRDEGQQALREILMFVPANGMATLYPELKEMADLRPDADESIRGQLDAVRLGFEIESLSKKEFSEIFIDLFRILNADSEEEGDELEITAIESHLLDDKKTYDPQIRRLKEEFPDLYALHGSFFNEALRTRDPEKMLFQRIKKYKKLKRKTGVYDDDDEDDPAPPETVYRAQPKVGRNDPCPCGSGRKYKHCCGT
jgi:curved DNA-binding protein CbpA